MMIAKQGKLWATESKKILIGLANNPSLLLELQNTAYFFGLRTLIALHHGRNTKNELFASCHGRMNILGGCEVAWI